MASNHHNQEISPQSNVLLFDDEGTGEGAKCSQENEMFFRVSRRWAIVPSHSVAVPFESNEQTSLEPDLQTTKTQSHWIESPNVFSNSVSDGTTKELDGEKDSIVKPNEEFSNETIESCCCPQHSHVVATLREENKRLRAKIAELETPTPETIVNLIRTSRRHSAIEQLRGYDDKHKLMQIAVKSYEPDVILSVLLFLRRTLEFTLFVNIVKTEPIALNIYANYLDKYNFWDELIWFYNELGQRDEALMTMLKQTYCISEPSLQLGSLKKCWNYLERYIVSSRNWHSEQIRDHMELLARQIKIEAMDSVSSTKRNPIFSRFPRESIVFKPLANTLFYCMLYHHNADYDAPHSPLSLRQTFRITEKRFVYTQLLAKAKLQDWNGVQQLVVQRGFFSESVQSPIGMLPFLEVTVKYGGPLHLIKFFVSSIRNVDDRVNVCLKYGLWSLAVQNVIATKDRKKVVDVQNIITKKLGPTASTLFVSQLTKALSDPRYNWTN